MRELGPVAQRNKEMISDEINKTIKTGKYKNISDIRKQNPSLDEFCYNNNVKTIMYSFSSQFTNQDYLELLNELEIELNKKNENDKNKIVETKVDDKMFVDYNNGEQQKTLIGIEPVNKEVTDSKTYEQEQKFEKNVANFQNINDIDTSKLNNEQLQDISVIATNAENTDSKENTQVYFDEYGNMTNTVQVTNDSGNSYYTVDEINGSKDLVGHEASETKSTGEKSKVKVKTKTGIPSAAFANTLILSFIIGSFFGIVFLAIYIKVMH